MKIKYVVRTCFKILNILLNRKELQDTTHRETMELATQYSLRTLILSQKKKKIRRRVFFISFDLYFRGTEKNY